MVEIAIVKEFKKLESILDIFCQENKLSEERTKQRFQTFKNKFEKEDFIYFLLTVDGISKGFLSCEITETIIRTHVLFVEKCEENDDLICQLIINVSKQLESFEKELFQIFFVFSLKLEEKLVTNGFNVYQRVKMVYDLKENQIPEYNLAEDYQLSNFTIDKLDEELQVVVDTFKNTIDREIFQQFSNLDVLRDFFYRSNMDSDRLRIDSPIILKNGKIVGVNIVINLSDTDSYIWIIALLPDHRGKGLGKYLMLKSHENCKQAKVDKMVLDVTIANTAAFTLYTNLGYKEIYRYLTVTKKYNSSS